MGWELDDQAKRRIEEISPADSKRTCLVPSFMAPPSRDDSALAA